MNLICDDTTRRELFIAKLNECKKETESLFESDANILKTLYVNKILTTFYINFEEEKYTLTIEINIPKIIYNSF